MADPVLWLKTDKPYEGRFRRARVWNEKTQAWETPVYEKGHPMAGRPVMERIPGSGFDGPPSQARPMKRRRFVEYLRQDGHIVSVPITNAAAHVPKEDTSCEMDRRLKGKYFAWIELGKCPAAMLAVGEIRPEQIETDAKDVKKWTPCHPGDIGANNPPCQHFLAEQRARRLKRDAETASTESKYKSEAEKHAEAITNLAEQIGKVVADKGALLAGSATGTAK